MAKVTYLTVAEAAERRGVIPRRIRALIASGAIKATRLGQRVWMIDPKDLDTWVPKPEGRQPVNKKEIETLAADCKKAGRKKK